ncbi:alpha/beta fold hydrolase [Aliibacillus thermotolerans]|uniref:Alpha/beta fold hydrolase n=1 Tax=Aliibacillus thermotolerans TaxID=1834418 RepID=A0ABW0U7X4_9BACI|nr:alpha/beta hydrolase [Aliibacillus thermotolerans]
MGSYIKTKSGHTLYVEDIPGTWGTIIAAHGLTGNHKQFDFYKQALAGDYRFISYDIRGRGKSDPASSNTSIFTHAEDFMELIDHLKIEKPILLGYSMGAYLCALAAASRRKSVSSLILLDGAGDADETARELVLPSLNRMKKVYPTQEDYVTETRNLYTTLNIVWDTTMEEIVRYEIRQQENGEWQHRSQAAVMEKDFESFYSFRSEEVASSISCPVLLIIATGNIGDKRSLFTEESYTTLKKKIANMDTMVTPVNHYELIFNEQPEIYDRIHSFLANNEMGDERQ